MDEEQSDDSVNLTSQAIPELRAIAWDLKDVMRRVEELAGRLDELANRLAAPHHD